MEPAHVFGRDVDRALNFVALGLGLAQKHDVEPIIAHDPEFVEAQTVMVTRALENATKLLTFEFIGIKPRASCSATRSTTWRSLSRRRLASPRCSSELTTATCGFAMTPVARRRCSFRRTLRACK